MANTYRAGIAYREPGVSYQGIGGTEASIATFSGRARISAPANKTIMARSNILSTAVTKTITGRSRVNPTVSGRARILRQQGWPIVETEDPGFFLFCDTRLYSRGKISRYLNHPTCTLRVLGRVTYSKTMTCSMKASINAGTTLSARARISPRYLSSHVTAQFSVREVAERFVRVVFYMKGQSTEQTIGAQARIVKTSHTRVTGHFVVPMRPALVNNVISVDDPTTRVSQRQTLSIRARII